MSAPTPPSHPSHPGQGAIGDVLSATRNLPYQSHRGALVPNVMIPGVTHAGASMVAADLGRHPQILLPVTKRIDHFTPIRFGREVDAGLADYDLPFAAWSGQRYRIETSPVYLDGGPRMVSRIKDNLPGLRVIIVLRNPADRLWTGYTDKLARGKLPRAISFETYVDRSLALRANGADRFEGNRQFRTLSAGFYIEHLPAWLDAFGHRARVVFTEDLQDEPVQQLGALFDWLGLDPAEAALPDPPDRQQDSPLWSGPQVPAVDRRAWPMLHRAPGLWRQSDLYRASLARRVPRQSERLRHRVRSLYAGANLELATGLRDRGYTGLPGWLTES